VGSANGDRSQNRRKKRRVEQALTPTAAGAMLSEARQGLGMELAEVHDRTGISWRNLEALEAGEVQRFSDPSAAAVAMRRYADLVGLDPEPLLGSLVSPVLALAGAPSSGSPDSWAPSQEADGSGHLRRYYGDHSHLQSFTQTAEVPVVGGPGAGSASHRRRRKAPLGLRLLTWLVLVLLIVGAGGLSVDHYKPQWLRDIHVLKSNGTLASPSPAHHKKVTPPTTQPTTPTVVTSQPTGIGTVAVKVGASAYSIVVSTFNWCWVEAQNPLNANPLLNQTLQPGQTAQIHVDGGTVRLELGSLAALIKIEIDGQVVTTWSLRPDAVPFWATFTST
jgi:hypothetical protein